MVVAHRDFLAEGSKRLGPILRFEDHEKADSILNTPPTFAVRVIGLMAEWTEAQPGSGVAVDSSNDEVSLDGLSTEEAKAATVAWLESCRVGRGKVNFKLRDWLFSRQRYWGEPFPIVFDEEVPQAVP